MPAPQLTGSGGGHHNPPIRCKVSQALRQTRSGAARADPAAFAIWRASGSKQAVASLLQWLSAVAQRGGSARWLSAVAQRGAELCSGRLQRANRIPNLPSAALPSAALPSAAL